MKHERKGSRNQISAGACRRWERIKKELEDINQSLQFAESKDRIEKAIDMIDQLIVEEDLIRMEGQGKFKTT